MPYLDKQKEKEVKKIWYEKYKDTINERRRAQYLKTGDVRKQQNIDWAQQNQEKYIYTMLKARALRHGIEFNLELSDIIIPECCPVFGIKLEIGRGKGKSLNVASVDRIDPSKGYIKGNIQIISFKANVMKSNATTEELKRFAKWILTQK